MKQKFSLCSTRTTPSQTAGQQRRGRRARLARQSRSCNTSVLVVSPWWCNTKYREGRVASAGGARRSVSRVLSRPGGPPKGRIAGAGMAIHLGRPSPNASCDRPERRRERPARWRRRCRRRLPLLLGLAPGGVFPATAVTGGAVRSYRTISPLPPMPSHDGTAWARRYVFCGTFPGVAPAGRYPAPCLRGARTFLSPQEVLAPAESGHPTV